MLISLDKPMKYPRGISLDEHIIVNHQAWSDLECIRLGYGYLILFLEIAFDPKLVRQKSVNSIDIVNGVTPMKK